MSRRLACFLGASVAALAIAPAVGADLPEAGKRVVNQANVLYADETGQAREALTNEVVLFIQQVFAATIEGDGERPIVSGETARFVHTLTNAGNGEDTYCVSAANLTGDGDDFERIDVVHDVNGDGVASDGEPVLFNTASAALVPGEITLAAGASADLLLLGRTRAGLAAGTAMEADLTVSAQQGTGTCGTGPVADTGGNADGTDGTNRDRAVITDDAVLEITKASTYNVGASADLTDDTIDYTITVTNAGASAATDLTITDTLAASLDFSSFGTHSGTFSSGPSNIADVITAEAATLAAGDSLVIRFTADVSDTLGNMGESLEVPNTATVQADLDGGGVDAAIPSNTTRDTAPDVYSVILSDTGAGGADGVNDGGDDDIRVDDIQTVNAAAPGETVLFRLRATNDGNTTDTYNIEAAGALGWLSAASYKFLYTDQATPLLDTNGDGIPDTGPLAPGQSFDFVVAAILPFGDDAGPHSATVTARSTADVSGGVIRSSDPASLAIGSTLSARVDLSNSVTATGFNDGGTLDADPVSSVTTQASASPGGAVSFNLHVANEGAGTDTYELSVWADAAGTNPLPAGWQARLTGVDGEPVSASPALDPGGVFSFNLDVQVPETAADGATQPVFIRVESFETGAADVKQDAVLVGGTPAITLTPDQSLQISPCGVATYRHVLENTGETVEDIRVRIASQSNLNGELRFAAGLTASEPSDLVLFDFAAVGDPVAILGAGGWRIDTLMSAAAGPSIRLAPGEKADIELRVNAPCETALGTRDTALLLAETADGDATAEALDTTVVSNARVQLVKLGAPDTACDGTPDSGFNNDQVAASPGECVIWQITLSNTGAETVCDVSAHDTAPAFTTLSGAPVIFSQPNPGNGSCVVTGADFSCTLGNTLDPGGAAGPQPYCLASGEAAEVRFGVRVE